MAHLPFVGSGMDRLKRKLCDLLLEAEEAQVANAASAPGAVQPRQLAQRQHWKPLQFRDTPKYLCYRGPSAAAPQVPVQLLHPSFLQFLTDSDARAADPPQQDEMELAAKLCCLLNTGFDSEIDMKSVIRSLLWVYLGSSRSFPILRTDGDDDVAGGIFDGVLWRGHPVLAIECRLDGADPWFPAMALLHQYFSTQARNDVTSHTLLLLFRDDAIMAVAIAWDSTQRRLLAEPLSDYVSCSGPPFWVQPKLAALLAAVKSFSDAYRPSRAVQDQVDAVRPWCVRQWGAEPLGGLAFVCRTHPLHDQPVVAKLCRSYGAEAHKGWHQRGSAPEFIRSEPLGCGWLVVVMEFLDPGQGWRNGVDYAAAVGGDEHELAGLQQAVRDAVRDGHRSGFCHGDLRLDNVLVKLDAARRLEAVKLVDFEFSGRTSRDRYPCYLGSGIQWHATAGCGKTLQEEHDYHFVDKIVAEYMKATQS